MQEFKVLCSAAGIIYVLQHQMYKKDSSKKHFSEYHLTSKCVKKEAQYAIWIIL